MQVIAEDEVKKEDSVPVTTLEEKETVEETLTVIKSGNLTQTHYQDSRKGLVIIEGGEKEPAEEPEVEE
jgi:hypothetical protein